MKKKTKLMEQVETRMYEVAEEYFLTNSFFDADLLAKKMSEEFNLLVLFCDEGSWLWEMAFETEENVRNHFE